MRLVDVNCTGAIKSDTVSLPLLTATSQRERERELVSKTTGEKAVLLLLQQQQSRLCSPSSRTPVAFTGSNTLLEQCYIGYCYSSSSTNQQLIVALLGVVYYYYSCGYVRTGRANSRINLGGGKKYTFTVNSSCIWRRREATATLLAASQKCAREETLQQKRQNNVSDSRRSCGSPSAAGFAGQIGKCSNASFCTIDSSTYQVEPACDVIGRRVYDDC